jgi:Siphovirus Gp157
MRLMEAADLRKAVLAEATLSIRPAPQAVRLINPDVLPADYFRVKREPDVAGIKAALKAGADVPGAALSNAADTLAILTH